MAAWRSMSDDEYDVDESYGQSVRVEAFYPEWNGAAVAAEGEDAEAIVVTSLVSDGSLAGSSAPSATTAGLLLAEFAEIDALDRESWPIHQPGPAYEAPIPGLHWYGDCEPGYPRVNPATGICEGCGERACVFCGRQACPDHPAATLRVLLEPLNRIMVSLEDAAA